MKRDAQKLRWDLLPWAALEEVVEVLTLGVEEHGEKGWQSLERAPERLFAAAMRHSAAVGKGEELDKDSGKRHMACAVANWLMRMDVTRAK